MTGAAGGKGNPQYGNPVYLGISFAVLIFILLITRYAKGFMSNVAVLLGIVFGFLLSWMMNEVNLSGLHDASVVCDCHPDVVWYADFRSQFPF